ncbi:MAG TPA: phenylalanine--tRNA ligase beta subunit-related protein [Solirubrobacteraceae bacterium]|jgi:DNA/RNA-binding domain of Phe-tRNA-synthetase-like protein|nr:phenylalanine--tRNA ligase beta subunit-related protein [Solirubrobacteraceae bacterium]
MSEPEAGWVDAEVADEFPELRLFELPVDARPGRTPRSVQERLRYLSSRFRGAQAVAQRQQPVPWAYRVFYRHVGLDPDADRTPAEAAMLDRLMHGGFKSDNLLDDALLVALVETGVPIWALDAAKVDGTLGVRVAAEGEHLGRAEDAPPAPAGRLVVADARSPLAVLFGELAPGHGVTRDTASMRLFSVQVAGVPAIHVEEALFQCSEILVEPR